MLYILPFFLAAIVILVVSIVALSTTPTAAYL